MIQYQKKLVRWINKHNLSKNIVWTGYLNESEMGWCYQNCSVFIMTSRVESFGQIALEAMSYGCICVSANNPCLPEIFNSSAIYYNPGDSRALSEIIDTVLSWDKYKKTNVSQRAIERASQFSWDTCAKKTILEFKLAIEDFTYKSKGRS